MKRVLIISPYFAPSNAADMQRVRTSLPYFEKFGWDARVVTVDAAYSGMVKDDLLMQSIPPGIKIYQVKALSTRIMARLGLGSLALRSLWYYRSTVNAILTSERADLIYFSTTQFPVSVLGPYWKKRFGVPYVIDMQDPWHSEYYQDKPRHQRPKKYWLSYRLHKYLEPVAMKEVDGLISVSAGYIRTLQARYLRLRGVPSATITFGAFEPDLEIASKNAAKFTRLLQDGYTNVVYVGRGGADMHKAIAPVFEALRNGLEKQPALFGKLRFYFIGTSYAPAAMAQPTILPLAQHYGVAAYVTEHPERISYYHALLTLQQADALFIPGSDDPDYSASKLYPYLLSQKALLAIFNENSNAPGILKASAEGAVTLTFNTIRSPPVDTIYSTLEKWGAGDLQPTTLLPAYAAYTAENLTREQTSLFLKAITHFEAENTSA